MTTSQIDQVAALQQRLDEAMLRAESLRRMIETISGELALAPLLTRIIQSAVELIGADDGAIGLVIEKDPGPVVRAVAAYNLPQVVLGQEIAPGDGLAGLVLQARRPILLNQYNDLDRPALAEPDDYAAIGMPIWWAGRMIGYFGIGAAPPRRFGDQDVATLEIFARHAAIAFENARRYEGERLRTEQLALVARIGRALTADLPLDDLLRIAADAIHELLGYPNVAIPLIDPDDPATLVLRIFAGGYRTRVGGEHRLPISGGIMGAAVRTRQTQLVNDVASDPRYILPPGAVGIRAELTVPIVSGDQVLGVLNIESGDRFSEDDAAGLQIVADQLAAAIVNARLFAAERQRTARIATINRIGRLITSSLSLDDIFQTAVEAIVGQLHFAYVAAGIVAPDAPDMLILLAQAGIAPGVPTGYRQSIYQGIVGAAARTRQRVLINDVAADSRYIPALGATIRAELAAPIVVSDRLLGVLNIESERPISEEDAAGVEIIADQLAVAIENTRLAERGQQLAVLEERRRLARELHDSVTQSLFSMSLLAQVLPDLWEVDRDEARAGLSQIRDLTRAALAEMRALLFELRPTALGERGLAHALREHVAAFERRAGIPVALDVVGDPALPELVEQALFRIAQEALANVARHAQARRVRLSLRGPAPLRLLIADDGQGFQPEHVGEGRFGLLSMRERAVQVGARLRVRSAAGQGTEVAVEWPDPDRGEP
ncbi:MAG: GAF domain-containing protein [Roseiflexaceae bacterium]